MKARTPTSTLKPPLTTAVTVPRTDDFVGEGFLQRRPIHGALDLEARKFVIAVEIAALDRDQRLVAGLERLSLQRGERQNSLRLESDVEKNGVGGHGDDRGFESAFGPRLCANGSF